METHAQIIICTPLTSHHSIQRFWTWTAELSSQGLSLNELKACLPIKSAGHSEHWSMEPNQTHKMHGLDEVLSTEWNSRSGFRAQHYEHCNVHVVCTANCTVLRYTALHCYSLGLCTAICCIALLFTGALRCYLLHCTAIHWGIALLFTGALHCYLLHCTTLHWWTGRLTSPQQADLPAKHEGKEVRMGIGEIGRLEFGEKGWERWGEGEG